MHPEFISMTSAPRADANLFLFDLEDPDERERVLEVFVHPDDREFWTGKRFVFICCFSIGARGEQVMGWVNWDTPAEFVADIFARILPRIPLYAARLGATWDRSSSTPWISCSPSIVPAFEAALL